VEFVDGKGLELAKNIHIDSISSTFLPGSHLDIVAMLVLVDFLIFMAIRFRRRRVLLPGIDFFLFFVLEPGVKDRAEEDRCDGCCATTVYFQISEEK